MTKIKGVQTLPQGKTVPCVLIEEEAQCDERDLKSIAFSINKAIDMSFLFEKTQKTMHYLRSEKLVFQKSGSNMPDRIIEEKMKNSNRSRMDEWEKIESSE